MERFLLVYAVGAVASGIVGAIILISWLLM